MVQSLGRSVTSKSELQFGTSGFPSNILVEIVGPPALARTRNQEPVVVETHLETTKSVDTVAVSGSGGGR
jgi:hypothetical protein